MYEPRTSGSTEGHERKSCSSSLEAMEREYETKSLPHMIFLKQRFSCFKFEENKTIDENLDCFLKLVSNLVSININISDEDQAIQILSALPEVYDTLRDTLRYEVGKTVTFAITSDTYSKD